MPKVFVSGTSRDLASYRAVVVEWAKARGYEYVEQTDFETQPDFVTVCRLLRDKLAACDAVIHLAGLYYGFEPANRPTDAPPRSYTQLEFELGREFLRQVFRFVAKEDYTPDAPYDQTNEQRELQRKHRERLTGGGPLYYSFSTHADLRKHLDALPTIQPTVHRPQNLPFRPLGTLFKGREKFLADLGQRLKQKATGIIAVTAKHAIHGLGGVGKTRTAVEFGWHNAEDYSALLFITADSPANLERNLAALCGALVLNLPEKDASEQEVQVAAAVNWLRGHAGWFLVIDNMDTKAAASAVDKRLLNISTGHVIVTSRLDKQQLQDLETLELDVLDEGPSAEFLLERTQGQRRATSTDADDAKALAKDVDGLALALEQAGAFIAANRIRISDYRRRWKEQEPKVLEWFDENVMKYSKSVAMTWQTSMDEMSDHGRHLLNVLCWLAPDPIPRSMIEKITTAEGEPAIDVEDGLADIVRYSLAKWTDTSEGVIIHRLVEEMTRYRLPDAEKKVWLTRALRMLNDFVPEEPNCYDVRSWPTVYVPARNHIATAADHGNFHSVVETTARLMNHLAGYLKMRASFAEAESLMRRALVLDEANFGPNHPSVAIGLNNLAGILLETNRYAQAEQLFRKALAIAESHYGHNHSDVARHLNNLVMLLQATNRLAEAEPLMRRSLSLGEANYSPNHPQVAIRLNNLASLLYATNRQGEAEPMFKRALEINEAIFGTHHPAVANGLNNLAGLLQATNRLDEAEPLFRRALEINEANFGTHHPSVAISLNNLADLFRVTHRHSEAEPLLRRALAINEASYGSNHSVVAISLSNLAQLLKSANRLAHAEPLIRRALAIDEESYGSSHPKVAIRLNNLAGLLGATNRLAEAEPLYRRALAIDEASLGADHPDTTIVRENLESLLDELRKAPQGT